MWFKMFIKLYGKGLVDIIFEGNWTKWGAIWSEIIHRFPNLNKCTVEVWFEIRKFNCPKTGFMSVEISHFCHSKTLRNLNSSSYLYKKRSFVDKRWKFAFQSVLCLSLPEIWLVSLNKPWILIGCLVWIENKSHCWEPIRSQGSPGILKWM